MAFGSAQPYDTGFRQQLRDISAKRLAVLYVLLFFPCLIHATATHSGQRLVIVTSFPEQMTGVFKTAFEQRNPGSMVEIISKKTSAGLKYLDENRNSVDLFWVSAPDAFEVLKKKGMLKRYRPQAEGIPRRLSGYPVNDPDGYYSGFAAAGYGVMWNRDYLQTRHLAAPREWIDLTRPEYQGHIGLSAPSRSGTTHLTVEAILQLRGWQRGWALIKAMAANAKTITVKSGDVPAGVASGEFGIGIVIDFYGLMTKAEGAPVEFTYPAETVLVPANIAILEEAPRPELAERFIEFLLSPQGQQLLLKPEISRLPIRPATYLENDLPDYFPRPYSARELGAHVAFDVLKSRRRYNVVNSLFDVMISYRLDELRAAMASVQRAETLIQSTHQPHPDLAGAVARARDLINRIPIDELTAGDPHFAARFTQKRKKATDVVTGRQAEIENSWDTFILDNYRKAKAIVDSALPPE
ncbi:MAG TPA: extracellular solute-binding protein [Desulfobulbus sp.]|nr:extracellular solute-binding protein [Desulfobulbus sp.]